MWRWGTHWGLISEEGVITGRLEAGVCPEERGGTDGKGIGEIAG